MKKGIVLLCVLVLAGCGGDGGRGQRRAAVGCPGDVSFLVFGDPEEIQAYRDVIAAYESEQPDVNVKMIEASDRDDLIARLSTSFAGGTPPDLFLLNYRFYGQFAARDVLEPIEERVDDSDVFEQEDFYEEAMDAFRFDGELTCLPQNISSLVVYYNKDLFKEAGVAEPKEGWTLGRHGRRGEEADEGRDGDGNAEVYGLGVEAVDHPARAVRLVERRRARRRRREPDPLHARHARGARGDAASSSSCTSSTRSARRRGDRVRGRRDALPQRPHRPWCSRRAARRRRSARSRTSTGTSPRCRSTRSRPASSTPTPTA